MTNQRIASDDDWLTKNLNSAMAIWLAAKLEDELKEFLIKQMANSSKHLREKLFDGFGPLATFSGKIDVAFAFGYISDIEQQYMRAIKDIRNKFAHSSQGMTFDDPIFDKIYRRIPGSFDSSLRREIFIDMAVRCLASLKQNKAGSLAERFV